MIVETELTKRLLKELEDCAQLIKESIKQKIPIIVRHHSDADGYAAGIAIERAIQPLIYEAHTKERESFQYYKRSPLLAPMYTNEDANRDISHFTNERSHQKAPLLIILDTGTSEDDIIGLKKAQLYGAKTIVIDHHQPSLDAKNNADVVINPHFFGSTYDMSAGMIAAELAHILNPKTQGLSVVASIAAAGDKVESVEAEAYYDLAKHAGYDKDKLEKISQLIDFEAHALGFTESKKMTDDLFGADKEKQEEMLKIIIPLIEKKKKEVLDVGLNYLKHQKKGNKTIGVLPLYEITIRSDYPPAGKITGIIHDNYKKIHPNLVTLGVLNDALIMRASKETDFDSEKIITQLKQKFPHGMINGGGHKKAASVRFIPKLREDILKEVIHQI